MGVVLDADGHVYVIGAHACLGDTSLSLADSIGTVVLRYWMSSPPILGSYTVLHFTLRSPTSADDHDSMTPIKQQQKCCVMALVFSLCSLSAAKPITLRGETN